MLSVPHDPTRHSTPTNGGSSGAPLRTLPDLGDAKTAYRVASAAAVPSRESYRVEHQFASGWIALRFLDDSSIALDHFANAGQGMPTRPPIYGQLA